MVDISLVKMIRVMRLIVFILLVGITQTLAIGSYSQNTRLTLEMRNVPIEKVLEKIEDSSEFYFLYNQNKVDVDKKVDVNVNNMKISEILQQLFNGSDVEYTIVDRQIVLTNKSLEESVIQQSKSISGKVTDSSRAPLPGVTVVVKGTTNGTVTNADGQYSLANVPMDAKLIFSFVGMKTQEISVAGKTSIDIVMADDAIGIEEVVAVGYGTQKKVNLTGAVSNISFTEEIENRPITNASQALSGKTPGIWVSQNSGKPGSDGAQIRIRGWGTLNNSNPLVIIDGIEGDFAQINPNDIESVSILKDAASAAIYGSKAANGVILVTTKTGHKKEKMEVNFSSYYGVQSLGRRYDMVNNSAESMELTNLALENEGSSQYFSDDLISAFRNGTDKYIYPNTNWLETVFQNASIQEHNISVRGGSEKTSTFLSINYLDQDGLVENTNTVKYGVRANVETEINSWLNVTSRLNFRKSMTDEPYYDNSSYSSLNNVYFLLMGATPYIAPYTKEGEFGSVQAIDDDGELLYDIFNPLAATENGKVSTDVSYASVNTKFDVKFCDFLNWETTLSSQNSWSMADAYNKLVYCYTSTGIESLYKGESETLEMRRSQVTYSKNSIYSVLNFNKTINKIHDFSAIAGFQLEAEKSRNVYARSTTPAKEGLTQVDSGTDGVQAEGNMSKLRMFSYFGRLNYFLNDKYLFEANVRADASSRFKSGDRWGLFPGFSFGWRLGEESFVKDLGLFSNLKLRASWGQLGNQNVDDYWPYLLTIAQSYGTSYNFGEELASGAAITSLVDEDVTWEVTSTLDLGVDIGLLNSRLNIEADYYDKETKDILVQLPISAMVGGLSAPYENAGKMYNKGFEFNINYTNKKYNRDDFIYSVGANVTYNTNNVTKFKDGDSPDQLFLVREGYSYKTLYGYKAVGIYQSDEEAAEHLYNESTPKAGYLKYEDVNEDGNIDSDDKQALGNTIPKYVFGFNSSLKYKGFELSFLLQGLAKVHVYTQDAFTMPTWERQVYLNSWKNSWTPENTDTDIPILLLENNSWNQYESSYWVKDISFIKLKNIQLGYSLPENLCSRMGLKRVYFYVNAQNVFSIVSKDYEGYDPERNTFSYSMYTYPIPRTVSLGINLNL